ncbi:MAG: ATP-binding protein [candidate division FCPU426 bacterium]
MLTLRQKFLLGNSLLLCVIGISAGMGILVSLRASAAIKALLHSNRESVQAMQNISEEVKQLEVELFSATQSGQGISQAVAKTLSDIEKNLAFQRQNVTEVGERELTDSLELKVLAFRNAALKLEKYGHAPAKTRELLLTEVQPVGNLLEANCREIAALNLRSMTVAEGHSRDLYLEARWAGLGLLVLATAFSAACGVLLGRWVLKPIRAMTESAREIASGNLDLSVPAAGVDEIGQLAGSFNQMALKLREVRQTDRDALDRIQRVAQQALDSLSDAVAVVGQDGAVELVNPVARRLFDLAPGMAPGAHCPQELREAIQVCLRERHGFEPKSYASALQAFDMGKEKFFLPRIELIHDSQGRMTGLVVALLDVTGLRQMDEMKSGLVATASHELKTPLTAMRMALHLLLDPKIGTLSPGQEELAQAARQNAERLHAILENLLDIGRLEAGKTALQIAPVRAIDLALGAAKEMGPAYAAKGVQLLNQVPENGLLVLADRSRLMHVFSNLLDNALAHTPVGGRVILSEEREGTFLRFSIQDSGEGIPAEFLPRIFERFFRVPGQNSSGAGLGLAIAKDIIEAHGGRLEVSSQVGHGSVFSFLLPAA